MSNKYYWLNEDSRAFLKADYLDKGITPEERISQIAKTAEKILQIDGFAEKFENYMSLGYYSLATPVWTNFGNERGLPVSCFGSYIDDTMNSILTKAAEVGTMSKYGGGTSGFFGDLRPRGTEISKGRGTSSGPVHFMELFSTVTDVVSQGATRRGAFAAYLPIDHPDFLEFLQIRSEGHKIQDMSIGVTISDEWMESLVNGDKDKRKIWAKIIQKRYESGYPYIMFSGNTNKNKPDVYIDKNIEIKASNLCSEIQLQSDNDNSFVCVLSSINLAKWDEIEKTDAVETLIYFLDAVNEEFVVKSSEVKYLETAHNFAKSQRALGLGVLGWHSLLQSKMIPMESMEAKFLNSRIFSTLKSRCDQASKDLAKIFGEPSLLKGYGRRNVTTIAIAPTTSSAFILGQVSQSIEAYHANYFTHSLAKGKFTFKNPYLLSLLKEKGKNTDAVWKDILGHGGSVQHLDFLNEHEKNVFKTFGEISQMEIIIQAAQRQKFVDQSQSLNIMVHPSVPPKQVSQLLIEGWKLGVKTFYYQRSANPAQQLMRNITQCSSCES